MIRAAARALVLAGALCLAAPAAQSAMLAPCAEPVLFPGADVNLVVIPYALGGPDEGYRLRPDLSTLLQSDTAGKLANLIQLDTLSSLRYPAGMAVVHLIPSGEPCGPEDVLPDLTAQMEEGKGLILLWGSFLEEEGQIYVQSYLQLFRKGRDDLAEVTVDLLGGQVSLAGAPGQHALGFAPRILTGDDLGRIGAAGDDARKLWSDPAGGSVIGELPATAEAPYAYYVAAVDPGTGRMRIRPHEYFGGGDGWVEARSDWPLRDTLPELHFVDGAMGYLAARIIAEERPEGAWRGRIMPGDAAAEDWVRRLTVARDRSKEAFARFRRDSSAPAEAADDLDLRVSTALSHLYSGMLDLMLGGAGRGSAEEWAALTAAVESFWDASRLLPYRSDARNLEAVARASLAGDDPEQLAPAVRALREALSVDPANRVAARNLATLYRLLLDTGSAELAGLPADDVRARLAVLER